RVERHPGLFLRTRRPARPLAGRLRCGVLFALLAPPGYGRCGSPAGPDGRGRAAPCAGERPGPRPHGVSPRLGRLPAAVAVADRPCRRPDLGRVGVHAGRGPRAGRTRRPGGRPRHQALAPAVPPERERGPLMTLTTTTTTITITACATTWD